MKEEIDNFNEKYDQYKVLAVNKSEFLLSTNHKKIMFDLEKQECKDLDFLP